MDYKVIKYLLIISIWVCFISIIFTNLFQKPYIQPYNVPLKYEVLGFTSSRLEVKEAVEQYFGKEFSKIVECESGYNVRAINKNKNGSTDGGFAQINSIHFKKAKELGYDLSTVQGQFEYAKYLTIKEGYRPWVCKKVLYK